MDFEFIGLDLMVGGLVALVLFNLPLIRLFFEAEHKIRLSGIRKKLKTKQGKEFSTVADKLLKKDWGILKSPIFIAIVVQGLLLLLPAKEGLIELSAGFWVMFILSYLNANVRFWPEMRKALRLETANLSVRPEMPAYSEKVLMRGAVRTNPEVRWAAVQGLEKLGSPKALVMLNRLQSDKDEVVAEAAKACLERLAASQEAEKPTSLAGMLQRHKAIMDGLAGQRVPQELAQLEAELAAKSLDAENSLMVDCEACGTNTVPLIYKQLRLPLCEDCQQGHLEPDKVGVGNNANA